MFKQNKKQRPQISTRVAVDESSFSSQDSALVVRIVAKPEHKTSKAQGEALRCGEAQLNAVIDT